MKKIIVIVALVLLGITVGQVVAKDPGAVVKKEPIEEL